MLAARPPPVARLRISCPFSHARAAHPIPSSISATVGQSGLRNVTTALTSRASLRSFSGKAPYGRESDGHRYGDEGHGCRDGSGSLLGVVGSGAHDIVGAYPASSCCRCYYSTAGRHALSSFNLARPRRKVPMLAAAATISDSPSPRHQVIQVSQTQVRGKKTRTTVKLEDLPQGMVEPPSAASETSSSSAQKQPQSQSQKQKPQPLPPLELEEEPSYPVVVLQARRNMQKFDNCVLLTRVGGFYELYFEQAEEYGPLLNIKVAQKKTNAGPVSMVMPPLCSCSLCSTLLYSALLCSALLCFALLANIMMICLGISLELRVKSSPDVLIFSPCRQASPFTSWIASSRSSSKT